MFAGGISIFREEQKYIKRNGGCVCACSGLPEGSIAAATVRDMVSCSVSFEINSRVAGQTGKVSREIIKENDRKILIHRLRSPGKVSTRRRRT